MVQNLIKKYEDHGIVLDFLPQGHSSDPRPIHLREPMAQILGDTFFTLLEAVPMKDVTLTPHELVYIGKDRRDKIERIRRRIGYEELTAGAKAELQTAVEKLVNQTPERFIEFFNRAAPLTTRFHQLELVPGIGKKIMWAIINERKKGPFADFKDLANRVRGISHPEKMVAKRVVTELEGADRYRVFVRPPARRHEEEGEFQR
jgi:putative nucleotide binding protein